MNFLKMILASAIGYILAAIVVFGLLIAIIAGVAAAAKPKVEIKHESVLNLKLNYELQDRFQDNNPFAALSALDPNVPMPVGLIDILRAIENAKEDDDIKGIILDLTAIESGYGKLSEIREKLREFKQTGKFVYAYADYYMYKTYYMASVADSVFVNPEGQMLFNGMVAEVSFFANTLKKLGIEMQVVRHGKFKGAVEPFVRTSLSEENKAQISAYINSVYDATLSDIAASRGISVEQLKGDANTLEMRKIEDFVAKQYLDMTAYKDEFYDIMKKRMGLESDDKVELVSVNKYKKVSSSYKRADDEIGVVYASGDIVNGRGDGSQIAAEDLAATLKKLRKDEDIKAVVLRIDSRGGSALASDIIWREAKLLANEKPLIVSMSDYAASGGYYIASPAHKIVADATTITGSIGVFGLVPNAQKLLNEKLGVNFEYVGTNEYSDMGRVDRPLKAEERAYIEAFIDDIYDEFVSKVSEGRSMTAEQVDSIAQGRVWTGIMAKEVGLVDEIGGLEKAISLAAESASLEDYKIKDYPRFKDPLQLVVDRMSGKTSLESQIKESALGDYMKMYLEAEQLGTKHTVQMRMPFDISVRNYELR